jgi:steroid Delta-isomerase
MLSYEAMVRTIARYVEAFDRDDPGMAAALYAENATVEDPLGAPLIRGREAIREFYKMAMQAGVRLKLEGAVRGAGDSAAFPFVVVFNDAGQKRIEVIDTFRFNEAGEILEMRAFWGPANMHGFKSPA